MYLLVSDVTKMMEISEKAFCKKYSDKIVEIPGCRKCIAETDFNLLISDDKELFKKMGMLEVTLHNIEFTDFCKEYPNVKISMQKTGGIFHDRFIVLDYGTADERVFLCGASSKDAGARITSIVEDYGTKKYASVMATLLQNPPLVLPK